MDDQVLLKDGEDIDWKFISIYQALSESFIERWVDWYNIVQYQKLSDEFIKKSLNNIEACSFARILKYQKLSDETIQEIIDNKISPSMNSEEYNALLMYQKLSDKTIVHEGEKIRCFKITILE